VERGSGGEEEKAGPVGREAGRQGGTEAGET